MTDPLHDVFEIIEPPPGGLGELRRRIHAERTPRRAWLGGLAVAAAAAALLLVALPRGPDPGSELAERVACADPALAALLCDGLVSGAAVASGHHERLALAPVRSGDDRVLIYRVASSSAPLRTGEVPKVDVVEVDR